MLVRLKGGLGNQMFQYAFGCSVARTRHEEVAFVRDFVDADQKRCYALGAFDLPIRLVPAMQPPIFTETIASFDPRVYQAPSGASFDGHWETEKYFDPRLVRRSFAIRDLSPLSFRIAEEIGDGSHSAFLHVRRTDYLDLTCDGYDPEDFSPNLFNLGYYTQAVSRVRDEAANVKFFVFSDDPDWCKKEFPEFRIVDHNRPGGRYFGSNESGREHEDIWLMSLCWYAITANSTFSWWGAWLGEPGNFVIAPKQWNGFRKPENKDMLPERWHLL